MMTGSVCQESPAAFRTLDQPHGSINLEGYDIFMLCVLVGATLFGAIKGFAWQLAAIASIFVSYWVAYTFREPFSESIRAEPPWNRFLAMLILYVGTSLVIWVAFRMVSQTIDRLKLREFDRQVGAVFGLAKGALYCVLITLFAITLLGDRSREAIVASQSGRYISRVLDRSESVIPPEIQGVVQPYLDKFDRRMQEGGLEQLRDAIPETLMEANQPGESPPFAPSFERDAGETNGSGLAPWREDDPYQARQPPPWLDYQR